MLPGFLVVLLLLAVAGLQLWPVLCRPHLHILDTYPFSIYFDKQNNAGIKPKLMPSTGRVYKHSLTFCVRRYVVIATKPVHLLQIRPIVHN